MELRIRLKRDILLLSLLIAGVSVFGQFHNTGTYVTLVNGAELFVDGELNNVNVGADTAFIIVNDESSSLFVTESFNNTGGTLSNVGLVEINNHYVASLNGGDSAIFYSLGEVVLGGDFDNIEGIYADSSVSALFKLTGPVSQDLLTGDGTYFRYLSIENGGDVNIEGNVFVDTLDLISGVVFQTDSILAVFGHAVNGSAASYVDGSLVIRSAGDVIIPIGSNGEFRPAKLIGLADTNYIVGTVLDDGSPSTTGTGLKAVANNIHWAITVGGINPYTPVPVELHYLTSDTIGLGLSNVQVGQSWGSPVGDYNAYGGVNLPSTYPGMLMVTSVSAIPDSSFLALASGCDAQLAVRALLEGAYDETTGLMATDLEDGGDLQSIFGDGGTSLITMLPGEVVPDSAVDVVTLILRDVGPTFSGADTALAWLMADGSIKDFETGTQSSVLFCDASLGNDYHVQVEHRNHLPVMSSNTFTASVGTGNMDFTGPNGANIYGVGYSSVTNIPLTNSESALIAGDAKNTSAVKAVNAADLFRVLINIDAAAPGAYENSDVNLSGSVEPTDNNVTRDNSKNVRYSTIP